MGRDESALNHLQVEVLTWISIGCPDGVYVDGYSHRIVARGLHRRGLITVSGRGQSWLAAITALGVERLATPAAPEPQQEVADVNALWQRVLAAGGSMRVDKSADALDYDRLLRLSMNSSVRPFAQKLESKLVGHYGSMNLDIYSTEHLPDRVLPRPVPVPNKVGKYHPLVQNYLKDREWQYVSKDHLVRAAHLLQAITAEAELRGLVVFDPEAGAAALLPYERRKVGRIPFAVKAAAAVYTIRVREIPGKGASRIAPDYWNHANRLPTWQRKRGFEFIPTGNLELVVDGRRTAYQGDIYRDSKSSRLEELLPEIFRCFEIYSLAAERDKAKGEREAATKKLRWESAMAQARADYREHHRRTVLGAQFEAWQNVNAMEQFIDEMSATVAAMGDNESRSGAAEWLGWARGHLGQLDPLRGPLSMPEEKEPAPDELRPFLNGWNPHGPNSSF
ncbi:MULTISPECIES: hypothetical protein [unclassified Cryobacterium]|uniref:hypothetical protein n=1 Tax=unclassified Cryobacterium TaxID=2649013 RepID=UPI000CE32F59|nr:MULTISPECIES: hypothetical protein [unclassified Cryobacterium]